MTVIVRAANLVKNGSFENGSQDWTISDSSGTDFFSVSLDFATEGNFSLRYQNIEKLYALPTDSVSKQILIDSDNFLAEQMLLLISDHLGDTLSSEKSIEFIMENYLSELVDEIHWVDGSGLSRYNQITPHAMIRVLDHIKQKVPKTRLYQLLPESDHREQCKTLLNLWGETFMLKQAP